MTMPAAALGLRPGDVFHERYTVVKCIATGGMGSVYEVVNNATRRKCALKVMLPSLVADPDLRARFQAEATIAAQIGSEHIVDVLDAGIDAATKTPFIVMELLVGEELCDRLVRLGAMRPDEAIELLRQAALALDRTHAAAIIHRDIKPENFFIATREDGSPRMKILDFGIAKVMAESAHGSRQTGTMGTPLYMPPEQVDGTGSINYQADLYSFGQVTYAMLVGESYFDEDLRAAGGVFGLLSRVMAGPKEAPTLRARRRRNVVLPPGFDAWFAKTSARKPHDRFVSAMAQVAALAEVFGVPLVTARPSRPDGMVPEPRGSRPGGLVPEPRGSRPGIAAPQPHGVAAPQPHGIAAPQPQLHPGGAPAAFQSGLPAGAQREGEARHAAPLQLGPGGGTGAFAKADGQPSPNRAVLASSPNPAEVPHTTPGQHPPMLVRAVLGSGPEVQPPPSVGGAPRPALPSLDGALAAMSAGPYPGVRSPTGVPVSTDTALFRRNAAHSKWLVWAAMALAASLAVLVWLLLDARKPRTSVTAGSATSGVSGGAAPLATTPPATAPEGPAKTAEPMATTVAAEPIPATATAEPAPTPFAAEPEKPAPTAPLLVAPAAPEAEPSLPPAAPSATASTAAPPAVTAKPKPKPAGKKPKSVLDVGP